ncbi:MAG: TRAM domain-containing protein [Elusimicrobia bacterium]|nr:TRAM domain-containing protein [Elusimicrobiota bacterium]
MVLKILKFPIIFVLISILAYWFIVTVGNIAAHAEVSAIGISVLTGFLLCAAFAVLDFLLSDAPQECAVIDLSAIIDGRVLNMAQKQILANTFILPEFVIKKLGLLSRSKDTHTKNRARRGLNISEKLLKMPNVKKMNFNKGLTDEEKAVFLSKKLNAKLITADFNTSKMASLKHVKALNLNDLGHAFKSVMLPGEILNVFVAKEAKEQGQALAYIDDGTPIIIEDGKKFIGKKIEVTVKSLLQTSNSKMLFCRAKGNN